MKSGFNVHVWLLVELDASIVHLNQSLGHFDCCALHCICFNELLNFLGVNGIL